MVAGFFSLSIQDSNLDWLIQSQMCYHYTNGQWAFFFLKREFVPLKSGCKSTTFFSIGKVFFSISFFIFDYQYNIFLFFSIFIRSNHLSKPAKRHILASSEVIQLLKKDVTTL